MSIVLSLPRKRRRACLSAHAGAVALRIAPAIAGAHARERTIGGDGSLALGVDAGHCRSLLPVRQRVWPACRLVRTSSDGIRVADMSDNPKTRARSADRSVDLFDQAAAALSAVIDRPKRRIGVLIMPTIWCVGGGSPTGFPAATQHVSAIFVEIKTAHAKPHPSQRRKQEAFVAQAQASLSFQMSQHLRIDCVAAPRASGGALRTRPDCAWISPNAPRPRAPSG